MRLIDADVLEREVKRAHLIFEEGRENIGYTAVYLGSAVRNAPTAEPSCIKATNLRAEWPSLFECSSCGWSDDDTTTGDTDTYNFCPNCGADVRGDQADG